MDAKTLLSFTDMTAQDMEQLQIKLWQLVSYQSKRYTLGDSSSLRIETAEELFTSVCFLLQLYQKKTNISWKKLLSLNNMELLKKARLYAEDDAAQAKKLYINIKQNLVNIKNVFLNDTLDNIALFFKKYDVYLFAHKIPCTIDYPLAWPVSDNVYGIEYILQYLQRLLIENSFLQNYPVSDLHHLFSVYMPEYKLSLINFYEPIAVNSFGRWLLTHTSRPLNISHKDKTLLQKSLQDISLSELKVLSDTYAKDITKELPLLYDGEEDYLQHIIESMLPRLRAALDAKNLNGIFMSW